jgi:poly(A) polymerase
VRPDDARRRLERRLARRLRDDPLLRDLARASLESKAPLWLVGGSVRDAALGRSSQDLDLACGAHATSLIRRLESNWGTRGFRFRKRGVTTWRFSLGDREVDVVDAGGRGIRSDLERRELTVNAIAYAIGERTVYDPTGGLADLRRRILRLPRAGVVREDPVRALRAARFLSELPAFRLDPAARAEIVRAARALRRASPERLHRELDRLLTSEAPHRGFAALEDWGILGSVLPEALPLRACAAGKGRPDVWKHTLDALARSAGRKSFPCARAADELSARRVLRWALLLHDVAKPDTLERREDGRPTFHGHEVLGARRADAILRRLRVSKELRRRVRDLVLFHLRPGHLSDAEASPRGLRRLVHDAGEDLPLLVAHASCDALASGGPEGPARWRRLRRVLLELARLHGLAKSAPLPKLVTGRDVMDALEIPEGPEVGRRLREIASLQQEGEIEDRAGALAYLRRSCK